MDSSFDAAASPDFPNKNKVGSSNMLLNQSFVHEQHNGTKFTGLVSSVVDNIENARGNAAVDYLSKQMVSC